MNVKKKIKTCFNYFGGKTRYLDFILPLIPEHEIYLEPFCGSAVVFLNKKPAKLEFINDLDSRIINFFKVLRERPNELIDQLNLTPWSRQEFFNCQMQEGDELERARRFFVRAMQSFAAGDTGRRTRSWKRSFGSRYGLSMDISKFYGKVSRLEETVNRLRMAVLENRDAFQLIKELDSENQFIFADPPYVLETRTGKNDYIHDFTNEQQIKLAELLRSCKSKVMLCGYDSEMYDELYPGWLKIAGPNKKTNLGKTDKVEHVWLNYNPYNKQYSLFEN